MQSAIIHLALGQLFNITQLGARIVDVRCFDASVALALARAARHVTTYETSATAQRRIDCETQEVRERIVSFDHACASIPVSIPFDAAFADATVCETENPAAFFARVRSQCRPDAPIVIAVPTGSPLSAARNVWSFSQRSIGFALAAFGAPNIDVTPDQKWICVVLRPTGVRVEPPRIVALLRLTAEHRWLKQCLTQLDAIAGLIVTIDDNICAESFAYVSQYPSVVHYRRRSPLPILPAEWTTAQSLAAAWQPDWILSIESSQLLAPRAIAQIRRALENVTAQTQALELSMQTIWDRTDQACVDAWDDAGRVRLVRSGSGGAENVTLAASARDYWWADPAVRSARKAIALAVAERGAGTTIDARLTHTPDVVQVSDERPFSILELLLERALARAAGEVRRVVSVDPGNVDAMRAVATRWPDAASTAICADSGVSDPHARVHDFVVRGDLCDLDLQMFFNNREYDAALDFALFNEPSGANARLARLTSILKPRGRLFVIVNEASASTLLDAVLEARTFFDAALRIDAIDCGSGPYGEKLAVISTTFVPSASAQHETFSASAGGAAPKMTVVIPLNATTDLAAFAESYDQVRAACDSAGVRVVIGEIRPFNGALRLPHLHESVVAVHELGIDAMMTAVFDFAPAQSMCYVPPGAVLDVGWCSQVLAAIGTGDVGIVALDGAQTFNNGFVVDGAVLAVACNAVHPHLWPRRYTDDRIRAAALAGIAARNGYGVCVVAARVHAAPDRQRAHSDRAAWETARAKRAGYPGADDARFALYDRSRTDSESADQIGAYALRKQ